MIGAHRRRLGALGAIVALVIVAGCGSSGDRSEASPRPPGIDHAVGDAVQAATLAPVDGKIAVIDGRAGDQATVRVTLEDGRSFTMYEAVPLVGVQVWTWKNRLVIAGTDCPDFEPASAHGTSDEDCGSSDASVVSFDLVDHSFEVLARHVPGQRPPGPVIGDRLLVDGGRAELDLSTGKVHATKAYPSIGALPCRVGTDLVVAAVDQGDVQPADAPIRWTSKAFRRAPSSHRWASLGTSSIDGFLHGATAAGTVGCSSSGPLVWTYADDHAAVFSIGVDGGKTTASPFGTPTDLPGPPTASVDATGRWAAIDPLAPGKDEHRIMLTDGSGWHSIDWRGGPLQAGKWAVDGGRIVAVGETSHGGWTIAEATMR